MIKYYESLLLYEKSILVILEAVYSSRFIKVLRPYLDVTREAHWKTQDFSALQVLDLVLELPDLVFEFRFGGK